MPYMRTLVLWLTAVSMVEDMTLNVGASDCWTYKHGVHIKLPQTVPHLTIR